MEKNGLKKKFDYKWVIIGLCFLMVLICLGFCSSNKSLYVVAITQALGIPRSAFSLSESCRFIATAVVNVFFGTLISRFGVKKLICAGLFSLIAACFCYAFSPNVWVFYIGGCLFGIGFSWTTTTMVGCVVNRWCSENRGTIMGAILASNGIGGAIAAQIVTPIIYQEGNPFGYRNAYFLVATILLALAVLMIIFFRENPKGPIGEHSVSHKKKSRGQDWIGMTYAEAKAKPYFYTALICIFFTGLILQGINGVAAAHMKDTGLDDAYVATVLSVHSLALAGFKFLTGFVYDKRGLRFTMNMCNIAALVTMVALAALTNSHTGKVLAMVYGVISSLALPLETIMLPIYASDLFGEKSFNKIMGLFVSVNVAGYAVGTPLVNICYDILKSYKVAFVIGAVLILIVAVTMQFILTAAHKQREIILAEEETREKLEEECPC